jgi:hypothetical protein
MAVADRHGLPVSICIESATPHEVKLATSTLVQMVVHDAPRNLIGDNAYDSDKLDDELRCYGIEVIARTGVTEELRHKTNAVSAMPSTLENRETICLVAELSAPRCPI